MPKAAKTSAQKNVTTGTGYGQRSLTHMVCDGLKINDRVMAVSVSGLLFIHKSKTGWIIPAHFRSPIKDYVSWKETNRVPSIVLRCQS